MIVVSDTSPLNYLILINAIDILPKLFGEIFVPPKVIEELGHSRALEAVKRWTSSPPEWLRIIAPRKPLTFNVVLDAGEADAISLAKESNA